MGMPETGGSAEKENAMARENPRAKLRVAVALTFLARPLSTGRAYCMMWPIVARLLGPKGRSLSLFRFVSGFESQRCKRWPTAPLHIVVIPTDSPVRERYRGRGRGDDVAIIGSRVPSFQAGAE